MRITNTKEIHTESRPHIFCAAPSGFGKTTAIGTLEGGDVLIISAEDGLLPLAGKDMHTVTVEGASDLRETYVYAKEARPEWVCVDSLTEIAEVVLTAELEAKADPRQAYGEMANKVLGWVRALKQLGCGLYVTAHMDQVKDEGTGRLKFGPGLPGQQLSRKIPHMFDEVFTIRISEVDGREVRKFQTSSDERYACKDRSGALSQFEDINLADIASKIVRHFDARNAG